VVDHGLLELERRFWEAAGDATIYKERFADDGRCVFGFGTLDKQAATEAIDGAPAWTDVTMHDVEVLELCPTATAVVYAADATREDGHRYRARVTSVYVDREGTWQMVLHQQTPPPEGS